MNTTSGNTTTRTATPATTNTTVIIMVSGKIFPEKIHQSNIFPFSVVGWGRSGTGRVNV